MKLVSRTANATAAESDKPRTYFVHIPKTAGITLKAYLENRYALGQELVIDEWKARQLSREELGRYRLLSGHYSSEVLEAIGERPDLTLMLVREPVQRFHSWSAHCRRVSDVRYREMFEGRTDLEVLAGPDGYACRQAHWVARALRDGADYSGIPSVPELPALLDRVDIVGPTEEIDRFMQLVSFRMNWTPPESCWHINRRPDPAAAVANGEDASNAAIREHLAIDASLYRMACERFWIAYADMLSALDPDEARYTAEGAADLPLDIVQTWLRRRHAEQVAANALPAESLDLDASAPIQGANWWFREKSRNGTAAFRWTGPDARSTLLAPPLVADRHYTITIDMLGAADWRVWDGVQLEINGCQIPAVHERISRRQSDSVSLILRARIAPGIVAAQEGLTRITLTVPETKQSLAHIRRLESFDTYNNDMRAVGLAVHRIRIEPAAPLVPAVLSLRRPQAAAEAAHRLSNPKDQALGFRL